MFGNRNDSLVPYRHPMEAYEFGRHQQNWGNSGPSGKARVGAPSDSSQTCARRVSWVSHSSIAVRVAEYCLPSIVKKRTLH